jgi:excisionase family DNA binding protein
MGEKLTAKETAKLLRGSLPWLYRMTGARTIPHIKIGGKVLFDREQIEGWLRARSVGGD